MPPERSGHFYAFLAVAMAAAMLACHTVNAAQTPPISAYATLPKIQTATISPDGGRLLVLQAIGETHHAVALDLDNARSNLVLAADHNEFLLNWCRFANNTRVVCSIRRYGTLRATQFGGALARRYSDGRTTFTRLIAADIDGSNQLQLVPEAVSRTGGDLQWNAPDQDDVISWLPDDPEHVLVQLPRDDRLRPSVYRLNIYDNRLQRVRRHHDSVFRWYADDKGELRFAAGYRNNQPVAFTVARNRTREIVIPSNVSAAQPVGLSADGAQLFVLSYGDAERRELIAVDTSNPDQRRTLLADDSFDVFGSVFSHPVTGEPMLVHYTREGPVHKWLDAAAGAQMAPMEAVLARDHDSIRYLAASKDLKKVVLKAEGPGTPPTFFLYDQPSQALQRIGATYTDLPDIAKVEPIEYPARDGYMIPAYLTRPAGAGPFPTVLLPHGGPNFRDVGSFDYWAQFLVSRGYAVLQPNFRGSTGYGGAHLRAGFRQWGLRMQDDVMDGLDWLIKEKIADPNRVCVMGGSYGGYVALVAAFKTPERIRCAISFAGVTNLRDLKDRAALFDLGELTLARIQDGKSVTENSPVEQVQRMQVPLLIVHGDLDRSVMIEQSRELVAALQRADKPHRYIEQTNGDHFLSVQSHRLEFFTAVDEFLAEHLAGSD